MLGERQKRRMEDRGMKTWQSAEFVVSGSSKRLPRQRSCLLRLMGNRRCETHSAEPPPPQLEYQLPLTLSSASACTHASAPLTDTRIQLTGHRAGPHLGTLLGAILCLIVSCFGLPVLWEAGA